MPATVSATDAARVVPAQCLAAVAQPFAASLPALSARSRFIRSPVLINTGQAVWHMPSTAQVSMASYSYSCSQLADQRGVAAGLGPLHLPAQHDPLPRRGGEVLAGADRFAVAAFHAAVDLLLDGRRDLEVADVGVGVVADQHARG